MANGYKWEAYQNERAAKATDKWVENYATDDRNLFHILHCIEKQKWIVSSKKTLEKQGYVIQGREVQSYKVTIILYIKDIFKRIPGKTRNKIKKIMKKIWISF